MRNKNRNGYGFSVQVVNDVWEKGELIIGQSPNEYRKDACGKYIKKSEYGNTSSPYGWEIDHIQPASRGGSDSTSNLQPLYWEYNRDKADRNMNEWKCPLR